MLPHIAPGAQDAPHDGGAPQRTACDDSRDGQQDGPHPGGLRHAEGLGEDERPDSQRRDGLERAHDGGRRGADAAYGHGHRDQRDDRRDQSQEQGEKPGMGGRKRLERFAAAQGEQRYPGQADQQRVERKLYAGHDQARAVDHDDIQRIGQGRHQRQPHSGGREGAGAVAAIEQPDAAQGEHDGGQHGARQPFMEEESHDERHHDGVHKDYGRGDSRRNVVETDEVRDRRDGEKQTEHCQHGGLVCRHAKGLALHQEQERKQRGGEGEAIEQDGAGRQSVLIKEEGTERIESVAHGGRSRTGIAFDLVVHFLYRFAPDAGPAGPTTGLSPLFTRLSPVATRLSPVNSRTGPLRRGKVSLFRANREAAARRIVAGRKIRHENGANFPQGRLAPLVWTSLGLNQGPSDYESFRVTFHKIPCGIKVLIYSV